MQKIIDLYPVNREELLQSKPLEKRLSCNFLKYEYDNEWYYVHAHRFLFKQFHDLFKFVTLESIPVINIDPETNESNCSIINNKIQLGTKLLYDKRYSQQFKVDVLFAIMIHEMFHKTITNASLKKYFCINDEYYDNQLLIKSVKEKIKTVLYGNILNILEDRRIERLGLQIFPGYVFYFDEKRKHALQIHKEFVNDIHLIKDETSLIMNFILYKILLPELYNVYFLAIEKYYKFKTTEKYGYKKIIKIIGYIDEYIDNNENIVYSDKIEDLFIATEMILSFIPLNMKKDLMKQNEYNDVNQPMNFESGEETDECHSNSCDKIKLLLKKESENLKDNNEQVNKSDIEVRYDELNRPNAANGVFNSVKITTTNYKFTNEEILKQALPHSSKISTNLAFLASRLNLTNYNYKLNEGEIDEDELYSISYSNDIFYIEEDKPGFELDFGILIDESGSMNDKDKIQHATIVALSCILAMKDKDFINLFVYGHSNMRGSGKVFQGVELYEYYNKKRKVDNWKNIFTAKASGGNADGYAIQKVAEIMMKDSPSKNKILVVISDGLPAATNYGGEKAEIHVKTTVNSLELKGFEIIQICIDNIERSKYMFKNYIPFNDNFIKDFNDFLSKKITVISNNL